MESGTGPFEMNLPGAIIFFACLFSINRGEPRRGAALARESQFWPANGLDHQMVPGKNHGRQLRVTKFVQQAEDVTVDRLLPDVLAVAEIAAHVNDVNPRVHRPR